MKIDKTLPYLSEVNNALLQEAARLEEKILRDARQPNPDALVVAGCIIAAMVLAVQVHLQKPEQHESDRQFSAGLIKTVPHESKEVSSLDSISVDPTFNSNITDDKKRTLANWISVNWNTGIIKANQILNFSVEAGKKNNVDPTLILAIIANESSFNPEAKSLVGAEGLMQVSVKWHKEKLKKMGLDEDNKLTAKQNVQLGTQIFKEYLDAEGMSTADALQRYNGAKSDTTKVYARKVLDTHREIRLAVADPSLHIQPHRTQSLGYL